MVQAFVQQPLRRRRTGLFGKQARDRALSHVHACGHGLHSVLLVQCLAHCVEQIGKCMVTGTRGDGGLDELRLTPSAVRCHDQSAADEVAQLGPECLANEMQATVDGGSRACRGDDVPFIHIKCRGIDTHLRILGAELLRCRPVCGGFPSVKQLGLRQDKCTQAQAHERGLALVCSLQSLDEPRGCRRQVVWPTRDDDHICSFQCLPVVRGLDSETHSAANDRAIDGAKVQIKRRGGLVNIAKHDAGHRQVKWTDAIKREHTNVYRKRSGVHGQRLS